MSKSQQICHNIPHDVTLDILPQLPVKTLVRFTCVSKLWHREISDPEFKKNHYKNDRRITGRILVSTPSGIQFLDYMSAPAAFAVSFRDQCGFVKLDFPSKRPDSVVKIVGSCHGLVCLALDECKDFFLWNPASGERKRLQDPGITPSPNRSFPNRYFSHGFGYDASSDDYKVFVAGQSEGSGNEYEVGIFSLKKSLWRKIQEPVGLITHIVHSDDPPGLFLNGILHWKAKWSTNGCELEVIFAFSLAKEEFLELELPAGAGDVTCSTLGVLFKCLSLTCLLDEDSPAVIDLWVMKEYGVRTSWVKLFSISPPSSWIDYSYNLVPLCTTKDKGLIMINDGKELIRFYPLERKVEHFKICGDQNECEAIAYVETLRSPNVYNVN